MKDQFRFRQFPVYQGAKEGYRLVGTLTNNLPKQYYGLADQLRRASLSVCLNIAEGSAKQSDKDFRRYLLNALGSVNEVVAALDITASFADVDTTELMESYEAIGRQLGGLCKKLKSL